MNLVTSIALALLGGIFAALAAFGGIRAAWRGLGRRRGVSAALAAFAVVATICAQKPGPTPVITVDAFLRDAGCYATNDVLHVAVTNAPAYAGIDFSSCPVLVYARQRGLSDAAEWEELLPRRTFSELPAGYAIEDATNYNYLVYLDYVPPSPVHTNGVFELRGFVVPGDEPGNLEQLAAGFINSRAILPPPTARDYIQDGLIAMWDGIENAGWGVYDASATVWKDLSGNGYDMTIHSGSTIGEDYIAHDTQWVAGIGSSKSIPFTACEAVFTFRQGKTSIACVGCSSGRNNFTYIQAVGSTKKIGISQKGYNTNNYAGFDVPESLVGARCSVSVNYAAGLYFGAKEAYLNSLPVEIAFGSYPYNNAGIAFAVGGRYQGGSQPTSVQNGANVCCIRLYSRALSADEIRHNYEIDKERFNLP